MSHDPHTTSHPSPTPPLQGDYAAIYYMGSFWDAAYVRRKGQTSMLWAKPKLRITFPRQDFLVGNTTSTTLPLQGDMALQPSIASPKWQPVDEIDLRYEPGAWVGGVGGWLSSTDTRLFPPKSPHISSHELLNKPNF